MFILNAFCCGSEQTQQEPVAKSKLVKKIIVDQSNINPTDSSLSIQDQVSEKDHLTFLLPSDHNTPTFPQPFSSSQKFKSDQCNPSSNVTSLQDEVSDRFVSPVSVRKSQSHQKEKDYIGMKNENFCSCDFYDNEVKQWSIKQVLKFLAKIGLKQYHNTFYENKIKGKDLVSLSEKQLRDDLMMRQKDIKTLLVYIQLLKQKSQREKKEKSLSKAFKCQRRQSSFYRSYSSTNSCRKLLNLIKNPIMEEQSQEQNGECYGRKNNYTTKDVYSTRNFSELLTH